VRSARSSDVELLVEERFVCWPTLFFELSLPNTFDELFDSRSLDDGSDPGRGGSSAVLDAAELAVPPLLLAPSCSCCLHADIVAAHDSSHAPTRNLRLVRMHTESTRAPIVPRDPTPQLLTRLSGGVASAIAISGGNCGDFFPHRSTLGCRNDARSFGRGRGDRFRHGARSPGAIHERRGGQQLPELALRMGA
jgi:hypothetical protein